MGREPLGVRLDSWKEIASYLMRSERTVRRWEDTEELPVHRQLHEKRGSVYAHSGELDAWRQSRRLPEPERSDLPEQPSPSLLDGSGPGDAQNGNVIEFKGIVPPEIPVRVRAPSARYWLWSLLALLGGLLAIMAIRQIPRRSVPTFTSSTNATASSMRIVRLTMLPGEVADPAFSPDGEKIAFTSNGEDPVRFDLYVQLVEGGNPLRLTHIRSGYICCAAWSPDGKTIAFARCDDNGGAVFVIPVLGGPERKLTDVSCYWSAGVKPSWTADGNSLVMADRCAPDSPQGIVVFSLINGNKRCLHAPSRGEVGDFGPVLSPDQKSIAFLRTTSWNSVEIYTMSSTGENLRRLSYDNAGIWGMMWASDGQRVVFESTRSGLARIWQVPAAGGPVSPETVYPGVGTLTRDGKRLAYVWPSLVTSWSPEVWRLQLSSAGGRVMSQHRLFPPSAKAGGVKLSPDSQQIAFECLGTGNCEICKSKPDGSDSMQLTSYKNRTAGTPNWSPDGKWIAFDLQAGAHSQIYVMDGEGRNQHSVVSGEYDNSVPTWSRNGRFVYFASNRTGSWQIWRLELSTRSETQITFNGGFMAFESYDAQKLFYARFEEQGIWSVPVAGGKEQRIIDALHRGYYGHFAVAEDGIYFLDSDAEQGPTILYYSFETRRSTPVLVLKHDPVSYSASVAASRDGKTVFFDQVLSERSIQMVENFQ